MLQSYKHGNKQTETKQHLAKRASIQAKLL